MSVKHVGYSPKQLRDALCVGLGINDEHFDRFAALITAHTYTDRMLTILMTVRLSKAMKIRTVEATDALLDSIANLGLNGKMELAESLKIFTGQPLVALRHLNAVRNKLMHPKRKSASLDAISELKSAEAFSALARDAVQAIIELTKPFTRPAAASLADRIERAR
jgi:hypothetical protein